MKSPKRQTEDHVSVLDIELLDVLAQIEAS
jgi:hypothetical protein